MKLKKTKHNFTISGGGLLFLCSISLLGVGFSSWVIFDTGNESFNVNFQVAETNQYPLFSDLSINYDFELCQDGMVKDSTILKEGKISVNLTINNFYINLFSYVVDDYFSMRASLASNDVAFIPFIDSITASITDTTITSEDSSASFASLLRFAVNLSEETTKLELTYTIKNEDSDGNDISGFYENGLALTFQAEGVKE